MPESGGKQMVVVINTIMIIIIILLFFIIALLSWVLQIQSTKILLYMRLYAFVSQCR